MKAHNMQTKILEFVTL